MKITKHLLYYVLFFISTLGYTQSSILIKNAQVWDGLSDTVQPNTSVLIQDNLIVAVGPSIRAPRGAQIIDARGKTLIPGLSDAHVHLALTEGMQKIRGEAHWMYTALRAGISAEHFLQLGFTTVRDLGGPVFGLKKQSMRAWFLGLVFTLQGRLFHRLRDMVTPVIPMSLIPIGRAIHFTRLMPWAGPLWLMGAPKCSKRLVKTYAKELPNSK